MAKGLLPWRALRPILLAGAATLTWLTLSSTAATADSTDSGSLLGGVTSSVSSLAAPLTSTLAPPHAATGALPAAAPSGLLQPVTGALGNTADQLIAAVPVVNGVVPAETVSAVAVPVAVMADNAAAALVETIAPPLVEAVPALEPVVQPVTDLVTGATPLPVTLPLVPDSGSVLPDSASALAGASSTASLADADVPGATLPGQLVGVAGSKAEGAYAHPNALAGTSVSPSALRSPTQALPLTGDASPFPAPAGPSSGAGSGASQSGPSGSAAWLSDFDLDLPLPGIFVIAEASEHSPSPVSFDPGSSPD